MEVGEVVYLATEIVETATGDHPAFLLGKKGQRVEIVGKDDFKEFPYTVRCCGEVEMWRACRNDLMYTKPFNHN